MIVENAIQKWNNGKCQSSCKITIKYQSRKENHTRNTSLCTCMYDKTCETDKYLKDHSWMKSIIDNKTIYKMNYYVSHNFLAVTIFSLLLTIIATNSHFLQHRLKQKDILPH